MTCRGFWEVSCFQFCGGLWVCAEMGNRCDLIGGEKTEDKRNLLLSWASEYFSLFKTKSQTRTKNGCQVVTWEKVINAEKHSQHQPHVEILIDCFSTQEEKTELYGLLGNHFSKEYLYKSICSNTYISTQVMTCCKMVCSLMLRLGLSAAWWINQNTARSWISLSKVPKRKEESYKGLRCTLQPGEIQWADVSSVKISIS